MRNRFLLVRRVARTLFWAVFLALAWFLPSLASAQDPSPTRAWTAFYDAAGESDSLRRIAADAAGGIYAAGSTATIKLDGNGNLLWETPGEATDVQLDGSGNVYLLTTEVVPIPNPPPGGQSQETYVAVRKLNSSGVEQWKTQASPSTLGHAMKVTATGQVVVTASVCASPNCFNVLNDGQRQDTDIVTVKLDAQGNKLWQASYDNGEFGFDSTAVAADIDANGNVYVTGASCALGVATPFACFNASDYATIKYDALGNLIWARRLDAGLNDRPANLVVDGSGNVHVTGSTTTIKYDTNGNSQWTAGAGNAVRVDAMGNVLVGGTVCSAPVSGGCNNTDLGLTKYDASGNRLWQASYAISNSTTSPNDSFLDMDVDAAGNTYLGGWRSDSIGRNNVVVKFSASGSRLWVAQYLGGSLVDIDVNAGGKIFAGATDSANSLQGDYAVWLYSQTLTNAVSDLFLSVTDSLPDPVFVGQTVTYDIRLENRSGDANPEVRMTGWLSPSLPLVNLTATQGSCVVGTNAFFVCQLGEIAGGSNATVRFDVTPTGPANVHGTASVFGSLTDPNTGDNRGIVTTQILNDEPDADLAIGISESPGVFVGPGSVWYGFTAVNKGPDPATNVVMGVSFSNWAAWFGDRTVDQIINSPNVGSCVDIGHSSDGSHSIRCTRPTMAVGDTWEIRVNMNYARSGSAPFTAGIGSDTRDLNTADNQTSLSTTDVAVIVYPTVYPFTGGGAWVWHWIGVTNWGPNPLISAVMKEQVTSTGSILMTNGYVTTAPNWSCSVSGSELHCVRMTPMLPGSTDWIGQWIYVPPGNSGAQVTGAAALTIPSVDPFPGNNSSSATVTVP